MSNWTATNELRWALRGRYEDDELHLQQKWERYESEWYEGEPEIEWRDVPVVEEE